MTVNSPLERDLSGIAPSGSLTLGNYLGALRRFAERQHTTTGFYFIADSHALTNKHSPDRHRALTRSTAAIFFAAGLDEHASTVFVQSHVSAHLKLAYLLECTAHVGELSRMIQFKEKGSQAGTRASLFTYPCLMAADILLYEARRVPVGGDQSQHVELARDLAHRFNTTYGQTFVPPEMVPASPAARVADFQEPTQKMSKSAPDTAAGVVRILDAPDTIAKKFRRAVTDSANRVEYVPATRPGVANMLDILSVLTNEDPCEAADRFKNYGDLKRETAEAVIAVLDPIRRRHDALLTEPAELDKRLALGAEKARSVAEPVLERAERAFGIV